MEAPNSATQPGSDEVETDTGEKVSKPGEYKGYSRAIYKNGYQLSSEYVAVSDGTKLAVDLYRPKDASGKAVSDKLPVLFMHTPYNRRMFNSGVGMPGLTGETYPGFATRLIEYGYVVAIADFRGLYASYGKNIGYNRGEWVDAAHKDAYDLVEWLAKQSWSTGKVAMWGCSATGGSQLQAATTAPPHLKAIFPMSCEWDAYNVFVQGGVAPPQGDTATPPTTPPSEMRNAISEPVDGDSDKAQLMAAFKQHDGADNVGYVPFRDSVSSVADNMSDPWWTLSSPSNYMGALNDSGIPMYLAANWDEGATKHGAFFTFNNVTNPVKLIVGPATHCAWTAVKTMTGFDIVTEELRFFDHWLKDIDNGVMDEPKVYYYTYNAPAGKDWQSSDQWPLANERRTTYFFGARGMSVVPPSSANAKDDIKVDYDVTADNLVEKGLVFESPYLSVDLQVTGHPSVDLWVSSTAKDGDFIATLQDVAPDGKTTSYNMSGRLRASLRKTSDAPYNNLKLPYHPSNQGDAADLSTQATELQFELLPISIVFQRDHFIRLILTFAAGSATPKIDPPPTVTVYRDATHRSSLSLPVIPAAAN